MEAKTWSDIDLKTFYILQGLIEVQDDYTRGNIIELLYGVDISEMSVSESAKYDISFLGADIEPVKLEDRYNLNGTTYQSSFNLSVIQTNQFIDFQNYGKEDSPRFERMLSVFFIPEGHKYNDGYDVERVQEDLLMLPIDVVVSLANFFVAQFQLFSEIFLQSFRSQMEGMKLSGSQRALLTRQMEAVRRTGALCR